MRRQRNEGSEVWPRMTRRAVLLGTAQLGLMGVLGWRMKQLQIDQAEEFRLLAEENRINMRLIPPPRGMIFDRNGVPLATNEPVYRIVIVREAAGDTMCVLVARGCAPCPSRPVAGRGHRRADRP